MRMSIRTFAALSRSFPNHDEWVVVWRTSNIEQMYHMGYDQCNPRFGCAGYRMRGTSPSQASRNPKVQ